MLEFYKSSEIYNELLHDESIANANDVKFPESDTHRLSRSSRSLMEEEKS
jgi:hypothetical protein